jgi:hypothetical protein
MSAHAWEDLKDDRLQDSRFETRHGDGMTPETGQPSHESTDDCPMATSRISWAEAYECDEPGEALTRYRAALHEQGWISIARTFETRLNVKAFVPESLRPNIGPSDLAPSTIFLLAATSGEPSGRLGHVSAQLAVSSFGSTTVEMPGRCLEGGHLVAADVTRSLMRVVRFLAPDSAAPAFQIVIPRDGVGDSHALACGIAGMLALLGAAARRGVAATGGFNAQAGRFTPVPASTLRSKLEAARRWGIERLLVVEGQSFAGIPDFPGGSNTDAESAGSGHLFWSGIEFIEVPSDPAALPVVVAEHVALNPPHAALRQALGLYDLHVARLLETTIDAVFEATAAFIPESIEDEVSRRTGDAAFVGGTFSHAELRSAGSSDPILVLMAADVRSRKCLHDGRSAEAAIWLEVARRYRHEGDLPDGVIGDYLQYEQAAHRAIVAIDQGVLEDAPNGDGVHAELHERISDLDERWCTKHQAMQRIFLGNTRSRRLLYLARLTGRDDLRQDALQDCLFGRTRWEELLEDHGARRLKIGNTNIRRQENFWLEHLVTEASMIDPAAFGSGSWHPSGSSITGLEEARGVWTDSADFKVCDLSPYDLLALVQWRWLTQTVDRDELEAMGSRLLNLVETLPADAAPGHPLCSVAEWLLRTDTLDVLDRASLHRILIDALDPHLRTVRPAGQVEEANDRQSGSIQRVLALRSAAVLDEENVSTDTEGLDTPTWLASIRLVASPDSLQALFDDVRSDPSLVVARCPY